MNPIWFVRMARLVRNPPSKERVLLVCGIVLFAALIIGFETIWGWPEWLTVNEHRRHNGWVGNGQPIE